MDKQATPSQASAAPVWLVTGGSTGLGRELAKQAIERGCRTVVTARDPAQLQDVVASDQVLVLTLDVTQPDQVAAAEVRKMFDVNVFGLTAMIQAVLPGMRQRRRGCIVNPIVEAVATGRPPHHLLLGNDAFEGATGKIDGLRQDFAAGEAVARGADVPKAVA